jgi:hypothetical protein
MKTQVRGHTRRTANQYAGPSIVVPAQSAHTNNADTNIVACNRGTAIAPWGFAEQCRAHALGHALAPPPYEGARAGLAWWSAIDTPAGWTRTGSGQPRGSKAFASVSTRSVSKLPSGSISGGRRPIWRALLPPRSGRGPWPSRDMQRQETSDRRLRQRTPNRRALARQSSQLFRPIGDQFRTNRFAKLIRRLGGVGRFPHHPRNIDTGITHGPV